MRINCAGESGIVYRILIVDDEKIERTGLRLLLGKMDQKFEITEAVNGKEALEWLSCNRADILVTDIRMPFGWTGAGGAGSAALSGYESHGFFRLRRI